MQLSCSIIAAFKYDSNSTKTDDFNAKMSKICAKTHPTPWWSKPLNPQHLSDNLHTDNDSVIKQLLVCVIVYRFTLIVCDAILTVRLAHRGSYR